MRVLSRTLAWLVTVTAISGTFIGMTAHSTPCHSKPSAVNVGVETPVPTARKLPLLPDMPTLL